MTTGAGQRGRNLPRFQELQLEFAQYIRNPDVFPAPAGIETRRMELYAGLFYRSIESFLSNTFPVCETILGPQRWQRLARDFIHRHVSTSPYFRDIPQEYLEYLGTADPPGDVPDYLLELAHYEWVGLALDLADDEFPEVDPDGDLMGGYPLVSPLAWPLAYQYPVHRIGADFQPTDPAAVCLIAYRNRADEVKFTESQPLTVALLDRLQENALGPVVTGRDAVAAVLQQHDGGAVAMAQGADSLARLRQLDIIAGSWD